MHEIQPLPLRRSCSGGLGAPHCQDIMGLHCFSVNSNRNVLLVESTDAGPADTEG